MTTRYGVDYSSGRPGAAALKAAGYTFACRYLAAAPHTTLPQKALTKAEADALRAGGIDLVSNWEIAAQAALKGRAQGVADATAAARLHAEFGGPVTRPIYFSVDFDASEAQQPAINAYFQGVASVIGLARTGAYGGYWVVKRLFDAGLIRWGWQTYAWSGGHWDARAQLRQVKNGITVGGADCDRNEAMVDDFGQWGYQPTEAPDMDNNTEFYIPATPTTGDLTRQKDGGIRFADWVGWVTAVLDDLRHTAPSAPGAQVDATAVATALATALAGNAGFLKALAKAVNDDAAARLAS